MAAHDPRWTLAELVEELSRALSATALVPADARAREVPDARTIRYYTTLGLLDRPVALRGRTALYGRRHLAQLVAIKRLQADGRTLAEVQERLAGLTARGLSALAALPAPSSSAAAEPAAEPPGAEPPASPAARKLPAASRPRFWAASPAAPSSSSSSRASEPSVALPACALAVSLEPGVQLLFTPSRALTAADLDALRAASAQVLAVLTERGLVPTLTERGLLPAPTHGERGPLTHGERGLLNASLASLTFPAALAESAPSSDDPEEGAPR